MCDGQNECLDCAGQPWGDSYKDDCLKCDANYTNDCLSDCEAVWGGGKELDDCGFCGGDGLKCKSTTVESKVSLSGSAADYATGTSKYNALLATLAKLLGISVADLGTPVVSGGSGSAASGSAASGSGSGSASGSASGSGSGRRQLQSTHRRLRAGAISFSFGAIKLSKGSAAPNSSVASSLGSALGVSTSMDSTVVVYDCFGKASGKNYTVDRCKVCNGTNACLDCAGVPNGKNRVDKCSVCDTNTTNDCKADCKAVWGGSAIKDKCSVCAGKNTCLDCAGVANGKNRVDKCGTCDTNTTNDCKTDCAAVWGGSAIKDKCGTCKGKNKCLAGSEKT